MWRGGVGARSRRCVVVFAATVGEFDERLSLFAPLASPLVRPRPLASRTHVLPVSVNLMSSGLWSHAVYLVLSSGLHSAAH